MKKVFWTKRQMDEVNVLCDQCGAPDAVRKETERILGILDNVYGDLREAQKDDGGFILFCTEPVRENELKEVLEKYHVRSDEAEYRESIGTSKEKTWEVRLYIITNDYGITIISPQGEEA